VNDRLLPGESFALVAFPQAGVDVAHALSAQPPHTTPVGVNVRWFEATTKRGRGGSRSGLSQYVPASLGAPLQDLNTVDPRVADSTGFGGGGAGGPGGAGPRLGWGNAGGTPGTSGLTGLFYTVNGVVTGSNGQGTASNAYYGNNYPGPPAANFPGYSGYEGESSVQTPAGRKRRRPAPPKQAIRPPTNMHMPPLRRRPAVLPKRRRPNPVHFPGHHRAPPPPRRTTGGKGSKQPQPPVLINFVYCLGNCHQVPGTKYSTFASLLTPGNFTVSANGIAGSDVPDTALCFDSPDWGWLGYSGRTVSFPNQRLAAWHAVSQQALANAQTANPQATGRENADAVVQIPLPAGDLSPVALSLQGWLTLVTPSAQRVVNVVIQQDLGAGNGYALTDRLLRLSKPYLLSAYRPAASLAAHEAAVKTAFPGYALYTTLVYYDAAPPPAPGDPSTTDWTDIMWLADELYGYQGLLPLLYMNVNSKGPPTPPNNTTNIFGEADNLQRTWLQGVCNDLAAYGFVYKGNATAAGIISDVLTAIGA
jgi:hypothetical protein